MLVFPTFQLGLVRQKEFDKGQKYKFAVFGGDGPITEGV